MREVPRAKPEMFAGLVGDVISAYEPFTEAAAEAIAAQFLVAFGSAIGRGPHIQVGSVRHGANENVLIVGDTAKARKGESLHVALHPFRDSEWAQRCVTSGLSSAEGLIHHVRDPLTKIGKNGEIEVIDEGVFDKRLLALAPEFTSVLKVSQRQGNTLTDISRDAWDATRPLRTMTRRDPLCATDTHISMIGHVTWADLNHHLTTTDVANGFANRFLFVLTTRARLRPLPSPVPPDVAADIGNLVIRRVEAARLRGELGLDHEARSAWERVYPALTEGRPGLAGALLARAESHVLRLALLYALTDGCGEIQLCHLESALAFWDVVDESVGVLFGNRTGDSTADRLIEAFLPGQEMTVTEVRELVFRNHVVAARLRSAIELLVRMDEFRLEREPTDGRDRGVLRRRPREGWARAESAKSAESPSAGSAA